MGKDVADAFPQARTVFDRADRILDLPLSRICFEGPAERQNSTDMAQPAIFVTSVAILEAAKGLPAFASMQPDAAAGLSLGEYTALYYAGALDFESALRVVARRGQVMQEAASSTPSTMVSIMGMGEQAVAELCAQAAQGGVLVPANFNSPDQIVISGDKDACRRAIEMLDGKTGVRAMELTVAGAFHSPLMAPAAEKLEAALEKTSILSPRTKVVSNVTARYHEAPDAIRGLLVDQLTSPVRWHQSMELLLAEGVERFIEIGPGRVLAGLLRKIRRGVECVSLNSRESLEKLK